MEDFQRELCRKIYEDYKERLHWYMCRYFSWMNLEDMYDIQQETWRKLLENIETVGALSEAERFHWLATVCHNEAISFFRKENRVVAKDSEIMEQLLKAEKVISLEEKVIERVMLEELWQKLSNNDKKIFYKSEFSPKDDKQKCSNAEKCKAYRVRKKMRALWKEELDE